MSTEEIQNADKKGINLNLKMSPAAIITILVTVIGSIISITRFADSKTSREDVEHIVDVRIENVMERLNGVNDKVDEIKSDVKTILNGE